jgi:lipopolysaccharide transport system ATP-binding protein
MRVQLLGRDAEETQLFETGDPLTVVLHYHAVERVEQPVFGLAIHRGDGTHITGPNTQFAGLDIPYVEGEGKVWYELSSLPLLAGVYSVSVAVCDAAFDAEMYDYHEQLYPFRVRAKPGKEQYGLLTLGGRWAKDDRGV